MNVNLIESPEPAIVADKATSRKTWRPIAAAQLMQTSGSPCLPPARPDISYVVSHASLMADLLSAIWRLADRAAREFGKGGLTLALDGPQPTFAPDAWIVSLGGFEKRFATLPGPDEIALYAIAHLDQLCMSGRFLGGWIDRDDEAFILDISMTITGRRAAERFGRLQGQKAIFNPAANLCVEIPQENETPSLDSSVIQSETTRKLDNFRAPEIAKSF